MTNTKENAITIVTVIIVIILLVFGFIKLNKVTAENRKAINAIMEIAENAVEMIENSNISATEKHSVAIEAQKNIQNIISEYKSTHDKEPTGSLGQTIELYDNLLVIEETIANK